MEAGRLCRTCRLRPPPSVFWFLFHVEKELAAGAAKHHVKKQKRRVTQWKRAKTAKIY